MVKICDKGTHYLNSLQIKSHFFQELNTSPKEPTFFICGHAAIGQTENGFLLPFFDLANNKELLALLKLYYMDGSFDKEYDYNTRGAWFAFYLGSFKIEKSGEISDYLRTNPKVWLCFIDKELLEKCRGLI